MHLETETMEKILVDLGYNLQDKGRYWQSNAVYREGDNKSALIIWKDTGMWKDFVASTRYSSFKKLVSLSGAKSPEKVDEYIKKIDSGTEWYFDRPKVHKMEFQEIFSSNEVDTLLPHYSFYNKKGISDDILKLYSSGLSMAGKMNSRFVFPVYDENDRVVGLSGRHLFWKNGSNLVKWKLIGKKASWLFPIYFRDKNSGLPFLKSISDNKEIILVESVGDSLALSQLGYLNNLVLFGLSISSKQISFLVSQNLNKIIISTNNDSSDVGLIGAIRLFLTLMNFFDISKLEINLPISKDFGEMLLNNIQIQNWRNKKIGKIKQINAILEFDREKTGLTKKHESLLNGFKDSYYEIHQ